MRGANGSAGPPPAQFYVTHCAKADSVLNTAGWSLRAASAADPAAGRAALAYPPYELPMDLWAQAPRRAAAPRRLARRADPGGVVYVVHSAYLEKDTMDRDGSFFTHVLTVPRAAADPAVVLRSWAADGWTTQYPPGSAKTLPPPAGVPRGSAIGDDPLARFLADAPFDDLADDLATRVCPPDRRADGPGRRDLAARFLQGVLLAARAAGSPRNRLYVHGEPGLVALLLYGAARLLPAGWVGDLTFTTYEPAHRGLREAKDSLVIGTYLGNPARGLDPDLRTARGYALDTFDPARSSPELQTPPPAGLAALVALAADRAWPLVTAAHQFLDRGVESPEAVAGAVGLARSLSRLGQPGLTVEDLLVARRDPRGAADLARHQDRIWPLVRDTAHGHPDLRKAFADLIRESARLGEVRTLAADALVRDDLAEWDRRWGLIRDVGDGAAARPALTKLMADVAPEAGRLTVAARTAVRRACAEAGALPEAAFLVPADAAEFEALLADPAAPPEWAGAACRAVLSHPATRSDPGLNGRAIGFLREAPAEALAGFLAATPADDRTAALRPFLAPPGPAALAYLDRVVRTGHRVLTPDDWCSLYKEYSLQSDKKWGDGIRTSDRLSRLLGLMADGRHAAKVWDLYLAPITPATFAADAEQFALVEQLAVALADLRQAGVDADRALPPGGADKVDAAAVLLRMLDHPATMAGRRTEAYQKLAEFELTPVRFLKLLYRRHYAGVHPDRDPDRFGRLAAEFAGWFPLDGTWQSYNGAVTGWLDLARMAPPEDRPAVQFYYVRWHIPSDWIEPLLKEEPRSVPFLPETKDRLYHALGTEGPWDVGLPAAAAPGGDEDAPIVDTASVRRAAARGGLKGMFGFKWRGRNK